MGVSCYCPNVEGGAGVTYKFGWDWSPQGNPLNSLQAVSPPRPCLRRSDSVTLSRQWEVCNGARSHRVIRLGTGNKTSCCVSTGSNLDHNPPVAVPGLFPSLAGSVFLPGTPKRTGELGFWSPWWLFSSWDCQGGA